MFLRRRQYLHPLVLRTPRLRLPHCPRVRFADPPVAGTSARGPVEEEDDDGVSVTSNPP